MHAVNRDELFDSMTAAPPRSGDTIYLERRGEHYAWLAVPPGGDAPASTDPLPDAWIYYNGRVPDPSAAVFRPFFDDLLEELESMTGGSDRCRWPLDDPYSHPRH